MDDNKLKLDEISNDLLKHSEIDASAIVDKNGIVLSSCTNCGKDADSFGVISAVMYSAANIASNESGVGTVNRVIVHSKHNTLITENANFSMLLSVLAENKYSIDSIHNEILNTVEQVRYLLKNISLK
ncbi:MAG: roadblock/LC7 domain-containing protein [Methanosarcinaceae archaeon]|nr:roadblock/LC7 domain-containing protein [Methanosarcinaceae archaeon]